MNYQTRTHTDLRKPEKRARKPPKRIRRVSLKQAEFLVWIEQVARPAVIARDGNHCRCCKREAYPGEKLDLNHTEGKGAHPESKRDISKLELLCRWPCHRNFTDHIKCLH